MGTVEVDDFSKCNYEELRLFMKAEILSQVLTKPCKASLTAYCNLE